MSMYECAYCGEEYGSYPKVIMFINESGDKIDDNILEKKWSEFCTGLNIDAYSTSEKLEPIHNKFNNWIMINSHWFCSNKCAKKYLKYGKAEWEINK